MSTGRLGAHTFSPPRDRDSRGQIAYYFVTCVVFFFVCVFVSRLLPLPLLVVLFFYFSSKAKRAPFLVRVRVRPAHFSVVAFCVGRAPFRMAGAHYIISRKRPRALFSVFFFFCVFFFHIYFIFYCDGVVYSAVRASSIQLFTRFMRHVFLVRCLARFPKLIPQKDRPQRAQCSACCSPLGQALDREGNHPLGGATVAPGGGPWGRGRSAGLDGASSFHCGSVVP